MNINADNGEHYHIKITKGTEIILDEYLTKRDVISINQHQNTVRQTSKQEERFKIGNLITEIKILEEEIEEDFEGNENIFHFVDGKLTGLKIALRILEKE